MKKAFTLVELLIGIVIFTFLLFALQSFIGAIFSSSFRALAMKRLADSTRTSLEIMGREMRLAQTDTSGCPGIGSGSFAVQGGGHTIRFKDFANRCVIYSLQGDTLQKGTNNEATCAGNNCQDFLGGGNIRVENARFILTEPAGTQPRVTITIQLSAPDPISSGKKLFIDLQTTVSRREI